MRDRDDNVVVVCSIENLDPMGVHTGDSITVAPAMTLTDREYQHMRDVGIDVLRAVGVDTGGCNIQFAVHPETGRLVVIEMNPRVSRSSALASKATGFPIAKIAAKLAIGYTLDEIRNDITGETPAAFEPTLDYVVVKVPRFAFEKFPGADPAADHHDEERRRGDVDRPVLHRGARQGAALDGDPAAGFWTRPDPDATLDDPDARDPHRRPDLRRRAGAAARRAPSPRSPPSPASTRGSSTRSPRWSSCAARCWTPRCWTAALLRRAKRAGLSDRQIAALRPELAGEDGVRALRHRLGIRPVYKTVDTCAAEFAALTPYHYTAYETDPAAESEVAEQRDRPKVLILGSGPNRIGQGIEFDYSCVHAVLALRRGRLRDRDGQLQPGDGVHRLRHVRPAVLRAADLRGRARGGARRAGVRHRRRGDRAARRADPAGAGAAAGRRRGAGGRHPAGGDPPGRGPRRVRRGAGAGRAARPGVRHRDLVRRRPGRSPTRSATRCWSGRPTCSAGAAWRSSTTRQTLAGYIARATEVSPEHPVLVDRFLDDAIEIDVDALCDGDEVYLGGVMEHIEEAGIHSGDSACALPPITLGPQRDLDTVRRSTEAIAHGIGVRGLLNVQYALQGRGAVRAGGEPAGHPDGAVRVQGDRGAAGQGGGPDHARRHHRRAARRGAARRRGRRRRRAAGRAGRGQGGRAAVPPVPHPGGHTGWTRCSGRR